MHSLSFPALPQMISSYLFVSTIPNTNLFCTLVTFSSLNSNPSVGHTPTCIRRSTMTTLTLTLVCREMSERHCLSNEDRHHSLHDIHRPSSCSYPQSNASVWTDQSLQLRSVAESSTRPMSIRCIDRRSDHWYQSNNGWLSVDNHWGLLSVCEHPFLSAAPNPGVSLTLLEISKIDRNSMFAIVIISVMSLYSNCTFRWKRLSKKWFDWSLNESNTRKNRSFYKSLPRKYHSLWLTSMDICSLVRHDHLASVC